MGDIQFTPTLCGSSAAEKIEIHWFNETESEEPISAAEVGCPGTSGEPAAVPGKLCVFTGGSVGTQEKNFKNIKGPNKPIFFKAGALVENATEPGIIGEFIGYRTAQFTGPVTTVTTAPTQLNTGGAWALTQG